MRVTGKGKQQEALYNKKKKREKDVRKERRGKTSHTHKVRQG